MRLAAMVIQPSFMTRIISSKDLASPRVPGISTAPPIRIS